jgi:hypothetical protein
MTNAAKLNVAKLNVANLGAQLDAVCRVDIEAVLAPAICYRVPK